MSLSGAVSILDYIFIISIVMMLAWEVEELSSTRDFELPSFLSYISRCLKFCRVRYGQRGTAEVFHAELVYVIYLPSPGTQHSL